MADDLQRSIKEQELEEERRLVQSLKDREALILEGRKLEEKLDAAKKTIGAFQSAKDRGKLSPANLEQFERVSDIANRLDDLILDIKDKIALIEGERINLGKEELKDRAEALTPQEEVRDRLHEQAKEEDTERSKQKEINRAKEIYDTEKEALIPSIEDMVEDVVSMGRKWESYEYSAADTKGSLEDESRRVRRSIEIAVGSLRRLGKEDTADKLDNTKYVFFDQMVPEIQKVYNSLWFSQGKEKGLIRGLINDIRPNINKVVELQKRDEGLKKEVTAIAEAAEALGLRYRAIMEAAWRTDRKIGKVNGWHDHLPSDLVKIFREKVTGIAFETMRGGRSSWSHAENVDPLSDSRNSGLRHVYKIVSNGSQELTSSPPEEWRKKGIIY